eukprot:TRINITY_DN64506_c0_g1_i1.p1 TRINITY_DN64506_c0_g1~~TRINITY_DN64506_c0_g1_i1.p1  ORF type:complete len:675 (-),score=85.53 TRINITY_DN64506_c0_g1_i1:1759-3783(-)
MGEFYPHIPELDEVVDDDPTTFVRSPGHAATMSPYSSGVAPDTPYNAYGSTHHIFDTAPTSNMYTPPPPATEYTQPAAYLSDDQAVPQYSPYDPQTAGFTPIVVTQTEAAIPQYQAPRQAQYQPQQQPVYVQDLAQLPPQPQYYQQQQYVVQQPAVHQQTGQRPVLVVGPVIGLVTHDYCRILVEVSHTMPVTCELKQNGQVVATNTKTIEGFRPAIFAFRGLSPSTTYQVAFPPLEQPPSKFKTFSQYPRLSEGLRFAHVACNKIRVSKEMRDRRGDVWAHLAQMCLSDHVDLMLHLGDQIYGDDDYEAMEQGKVSRQQAIGHCKFMQAKELVDRTPRHQWESIRPRIVEFYREMYRETWQWWPTRVALANCPNIMMYDDHEIRDDLGDKPEELDPNSATRMIAECARLTCFEYQRQLYEDFDLSDPVRAPKAPRENHIIHAMGEYGILMIDSRGAKVFNRVPNDPYPFLTSNQWVEIQRALAPQGELANVKFLQMATQIPVVFFDQATTEQIAKKADDFEGMWSYRANAKEQLMLLEQLQAWQTARPDRQVLLTGGDVHLAGYTKIFKMTPQGKRLMFFQMITGPVSNSTIGKVAMMGTNALKEKGEDLGAGWKYEQFKWSNKRNFGMVRTKPGPGPYFSLGHVYGLDFGTEERTIELPLGNSGGGGCCSIM